jgi:hypothetical protein
MEIPEIQYQPGQVSSNVAPVQQVDVTQGLRENQARTASEMQAQLAQLQRNGGTQLKNVQSQAFPVEELAAFSKTAASIMDEKAESMKSDLEAEMTMLAYQDGVPVNKEFDAQEKELEEGYKELDGRANKYQAETGDAEGAERIRNLSGWKEYYYNKAVVQQAGQGFGAFLNENAGRAIPVNGEMVSLKSANPEQRAGVVAYLTSEYMQPYQGMNKSFLGKHMFPSMQKGQASALASLSAERQKLIKANQEDEAGVLFRSDPTSAGAQQYRSTLTALGYSNKEIRAKMLDNANTVAEVEAIGAIEFGGNGKTFAENYGKEYNEALNSATTRQNDDNDRFEENLKQADQQAKIDYIKAEQKDLADGSFDANPASLKAKADEARKAGFEETAQHIESRISETVAAKTSTAIRKGYELQIQAGVIPSEEEILMNTALTQEDKQALLGKAEENASKAEPSSPRAKSNKKEIEAELEARAGWTKDKAANASIEGMKFQAWQRYTQTYNNELQAGASPDVAAQKAMADFRSEFGTDPGKGTYAVGEDANNGAAIGSYINYSRAEAASTTTSPSQQVFTNIKGMTPGQRNSYLNEQPDLFYGEEQILTQLQENATTTGKLGAIPPIYYELQQKTGGKQSILEFVENRLEANGLPPLPENITSVVNEVQGAFDEDSYKHISYKPNATRTDIGLINSGVDPIYAGKVPAAVADDEEFQAAVTDTAGRLGIPEEHLYAAMSFETGGTFNPGIVNPTGSRATGLIQFIPSTAQGLGTSVEELAGMSRSRQMHYVEKYLSNKGIGPDSSLDDIYMSILFPAAVGKGDDYVLFGQGAMSGYTGRAYDQNKNLDKNGDGSITKAEAAQRVIDHRNSMSPWRKPLNVRPGLQ